MFLLQLQLNTDRVSKSTLRRRSAPPGLSALHVALVVVIQAVLSALGARKRAQQDHTDKVNSAMSYHVVPLHLKNAIREYNKYLWDNGHASEEVDARGRLRVWRMEEGTEEEGREEANSMASSNAASREGAAGILCFSANARLARRARATAR